MYEQPTRRFRYRYSASLWCHTRSTNLPVSSYRHDLRRRFRYGFALFHTTVSAVMLDIECKSFDTSRYRTSDTDECEGSQGSGCYIQVSGISYQVLLLYGVEYRIGSFDLSKFQYIVSSVFFLSILCPISVLSHADIERQFQAIQIY